LEVSGLLGLGRLLLFLLLEGGGLGVGLGAVLWLLLVRLGGRGQRPAVAVPGPGGAVDSLLDVGDQRGGRARKGVYLVCRELRAVGEMRLILGEQALEAEHEGEVATPLD